MRYDARKLPCQTRHAIILAAGESTRTRPLTLVRPKPLIPLLGKPLLAHILDEFFGLVDDITLVVGYRADDIQAHFGATYRGMHISYVRQNRVNGTAGALMSVAEQAAAEGSVGLEEPFFLVYGDNLISQRDILAVCEERYCLAGLQIADPTSFGVLNIVGDRVESIIEKPKVAPPNALANPGIYHFDHHVLSMLPQIHPSPRGEYELTDLIALLAKDYHVGYRICQGHWIPIGNPWEVLVATAWLLDDAAQFQPKEIDVSGFQDCTISGWVEIGQVNHVGKGCTIIGPSFIGQGVVIGDGCTIFRSVIESGAVVGDGTTMEHSVLFPNAQIGANSYLQWSLLGDHAIVGERARMNIESPTIRRTFPYTAGWMRSDQEYFCGTVIGPDVRFPQGVIFEPKSIIFPKPKPA